ncbi:protein ECERIFERUM 26-like [Magnolia sinica]|uniref:protein ECERIFERUM 26-like n=1 Tax=Magnolia sinica TaxID=86752 RepID=UPI002658B793|nr:protein ECERIFERUM 26-like [Magnolia sinica]
MVSGDVQNPLHAVKTSSVVPAAVTGETAVHELTNMDLAMKLHYLRTVYYYNKEAFDGLDILSIKRPMFRWLDFYSTVAGRIRRSDAGRPFIKCNDSGVRIIEGRCNETLDEWLDKKEWDLHKHLVPSQVIGPEMLFSPLAVLQFTWFRCGGVAIGFSWSHALGDVFSALRFIDTWAHIMAGTPPTQSINPPRSTVEKPIKPPNPPTKQLPAKPVEPVGDHWLTANNCKMDTFLFHITDTQLKHIQSKISGQIPPFEALSALIWRSLAKMREGKEPKIVTICRTDPRGKENVWLSNDQIISTVEADLDVKDAELSELAALIAKGGVDVSKEIEVMVDSNSGSPDLIVYGVNLTFVDLEQVNFFEMEFKGQKPILVQFKIDGVGDEGAVLVVRDHASGGDDKCGSGGWMVTVILPDNEVMQLKSELEREWCIT